jgi:hypothetical protein
MLPVFPRLPSVIEMVDKKFYFILHSPRQSGKTTYLITLTDMINAEGQYYALYCSLEPLEGVADDNEAMTRVVSLICDSLATSEIEIFQRLLEEYEPSNRLTAATKVKNILNFLCSEIDKDLVVFFDEADCLTGPSLITFLRQVRLGFNTRSRNRSSKFPRSIALVGMRNIRDYLASNHPETSGQHLASPYNIVSERLTLANFTQDEIGCLYRQHTESTGQVFDDGAIGRACYWTEGQPWLVNALAYEIVERQIKGNFSAAISIANVDQAAKDLILCNDTHFDSLKARLNEFRVRKVMEPIVVSAGNMPFGLLDDDISYVFDLGLLKKDDKNNLNYLPSNPIYKEVIARALSRDIQLSMPTSLANRWMGETTMDMSGLLRAFQIYWEETAELLKDKTGEEANDNAFKTNENLVILVLYAFLQRVLNGGAEITREYALGRLRVDICITYKEHRYPLEVKIKGYKSEADNMEQLLGYMDRCGSSVGWLVVCDKDLSKTWKDKLTWETKTKSGQTIHVIGC